MIRPAIAVLAVPACVLLTACGTHASAARVPAARYVVCYDVVGPCAGLTPRHEPASLLMSGDGSLYAKGIAWIGWGTATAIGHGTAEANNCQPDCAAGTFSAHPVTITLTQPRPWHDDMVYTRAAYSVPSLHLGNTFASGLMP